MEKSKAQLSLEAAGQKLGDALYRSGLMQWEIRSLKGQVVELDVKINNLNIDYKSAEEELKKEQALKAIVEAQADQAGA